MTPKPSKKIPQQQNRKKSWENPVQAKILKKFSKKTQHPGLTFDTKPEQNVYAVRDGVVAYSGDKMKSHGRMIIIKHPFGFYSSYTQNKQLKVSDGDSVQQGQIIAITGEQPFYFEMKKFSEFINPLKYLNNK